MTQMHDSDVNKCVICTLSSVGKLNFRPLDSWPHPLVYAKPLVFLGPNPLKESNGNLGALHKTIAPRGHKFGTHELGHDLMRHANFGGQASHHWKFTTLSLGYFGPIKPNGME